MATNKITVKSPQLISAEILVPTPNKTISPSVKIPDEPMVSNPKIHTRYEYEMLDHGVKFDNDDPNSRSITNQSDKDGADINLIMERYEKTGLITDLRTGQTRLPNYGDFSEIEDFHTIQSKIAKATQAFEALPAKVRTRFENDPAKIIDFLADPENDREAVKLGLKDKSVLPEEPSGMQNTQEQAKPVSGQPANPAA